VIAMTTTTTGKPTDNRVDRLAPVWCCRLSAALAATSAIAGAGTLFLPDVLSGTAVMNGSARGTAAVVLFLAVPLLAGAVARSAQGSVRAFAVWLGVTAYLTYNAVMFCFATPFNPLFPLYVGMLGMSIFTLTALVVRGLRLAAADPGAAGRWVAGFIGLVAVLNAVLWLSGVVPALVDDEPTAMLEGTGLTTNPVYVQDLAFWLPAMLVLAVGLARDGRRYLVPAAGGLVFWVVEAIGVGVDQWMGGLADPDSTVASATLAPGFFVLAVACLVPAVVLLRRLPGRV
jgi:hypothetical protein